MKAYLDIETSFSGDITIIGIYYSDGRLLQLVGDNVNRANLLDSLNGASTILPITEVVLICPLSETS